MKIELQRLVGGIWYIYGKYDMSITHDATAFGEAVSELAKNFEIRTIVSYTDVEKQLKEERELNAEIKARFVKCNTCTQDMKDKCLMFSENLCEGERCEELVDLMALVEKNDAEEKIADLKANFDYILEGKDVEINELKEKLAQTIENDEVAYETLKLHDQEEIGMLKSRVEELQEQNSEMFNTIALQEQQIKGKENEFKYFSNSFKKKIVELKKENAELKDYRLETLEEEQTGIQKYALNLEHKLSWYDTQLSQAKEIIKELLSFSVQLCDCRHTEDFEKAREQAEQFLKE